MAEWGLEPTQSWPVSLTTTRHCLSTSLLRPETPGCLRRPHPFLFFTLQEGKERRSGELLVARLPHPLLYPIHLH